MLVESGDSSAGATLASSLVVSTTAFSSSLCNGGIEKPLKTFTPHTLTASRKDLQPEATQLMVEIGEHDCPCALVGT